MTKKNKIYQITSQLSPEEIEKAGSSKIFSLTTGKPLGYEGFRGLGVAPITRGPNRGQLGLHSHTGFDVASKDDSGQLRFQSDSSWIFHTMQSTCSNHHVNHPNCGPDTVNEQGQIRGGCKSHAILEAQRIQKDPNSTERARLEAWEQARRYINTCHQGNEQNLIEDCSCGVYTHLALEDTIKYNRDSRKSLPVRLLMSGPLWKGNAGVRAPQATLTGIFLPSSLRADVFQDFGSGIKDDQVKELQKIYQVPLLDYRTKSQWPTSAQVVHQLGIRT